MRVTCEECGLTYNDIYRWTDCPHEGFECSPSARASLEASGIPADEPEEERPTKPNSHERRLQEIVRRKNSVRRTVDVNHNTRLVTTVEIRPIIGQPVTPELYEEMHDLAKEHRTILVGEGAEKWQEVLARHRQLDNAPKLNWFRRALRWMGIR